MKQSLILVILIGCVSSPSGSTVDASSVLDLPEIMAKDAQQPPDLPMAMDRTVAMDHTVAAADLVSMPEVPAPDLVPSDVCVPTPERCNNLDDDCDGRVDEPEEADAACVVPQGRGSCIAGRCFLASCDADRGDCDRDLSNGCETDLTRTLDHCGACGRRCGGFDACVTGVCGPMTDMDVGQNHACAVHSTGRVLCWGRNDWGQLGDGTRVDRAQPVVVQALGPASVVRTGSRQTCALSLDRRRIFCWGKQHLGAYFDQTSVLLRPSELIPTVRERELDRVLQQVPNRPIAGLFVGGSQVIAAYGFERPRDRFLIGVQQQSDPLSGSRGAAVDGQAQITRLIWLPMAWGESSEHFYNGERLAEHPEFFELDQVGCPELWGVASPLWSQCQMYALRDDRFAEMSFPQGGTNFVTLTLMGHLAGRASYFYAAELDGQRRRPVFLDRLAGGGDGVLCGLVRGEPTWRCGEGIRSELWVARTQPFLTRSLVRVRLFQEGLGGCYLTEGGRVFCWGDNVYGRLGDGTSLPRSEPVPVLGR
jgi:hypothetical protein